MTVGRSGAIARMNKLRREVMPANDPRKGEHFRGATFVAKHKATSLETRTREVSRSIGPVNSEENVVVHNNTHKAFADGLVSADDQGRGEQTRRAGLDSTHFSVYVRERYCIEAGGFGRKGDSARGYNG